MTSLAYAGGSPLETDISARRAPRPHLRDIHDLIIARLEDAGRTLAMLPMPYGGRPAGPRSAWPDVLQNYWDVVGHAEVGTIEERQDLLAMARLHPKLQADQRAIARLDEVLGWLWLIKEPHCRRAVAARMLVHPVSLRPLHTWKRLARDFRASDMSVRRWFDRGVQSIIDGIADPR